MSSVETLLKEIKSIFGKEIIQASIEHNELTIEVKIDDLLPTLKTLKQHKAVQFVQLIDLCGVDFKDYGEGTWTMKLPLIILATCAVGVGFIPFSQLVTADGKALATHIDWVFSIAPVVLSVLAILLAASFYNNQNEKSDKVVTAFGSFYTAAFQKFYF